ncbi:MAG: hypothetical protein AAF998_21310 [Bacteroidota bacterium]
MRKIRLILELLTVAALVTVAVLQYRMVDLSLAERKEQEDQRLRDYVISYEFNYVKSELIARQKENWAVYQERSRNANWSLGLLGAAVIMGVSARALRERKSLQSGT